MRQFSSWCFPPRKLAANIEANLPRKRNCNCRRSLQTHPGEFGFASSVPCERPSLTSVNGRSLAFYGHIAWSGTFCFHRHCRNPPSGTASWKPQRNTIRPPRTLANRTSRTGWGGNLQPRMPEAYPSRTRELARMFRGGAKGSPNSKDQVEKTGEFDALRLASGESRSKNWPNRSRIRPKADRASPLFSWETAFTEVCGQEKFFHLFLIDFPLQAKESCVSLKMSKRRGTFQGITERGT